VIKVTVQQIIDVVPTIARTRADDIAHSLRANTRFYKITTNDVLHECLANILHESGYFRLRYESLNYSAKRLVQIWPKHFTAVNAHLFAFNPVALANKIYGTGSIAKSLGNTKPEHGFMTRGSGFMQLTGFSNHQAFADYISMDVESAGEAMRNSDIMAMDSSLWFFAIRANLIPLAKGDNLKIVTKRVNPGLIGFVDRENAYKKVKTVFK